MIVNDPATVAEVTAAFQRYEQGLIDADAAALDELFWNSPLTIRYGDGQIQHGHAPIKAFNARRRKLGPDRALTETVVTTFGHDFATVSTLYVDVPPGKIGRQMQTWARLDGGWHVVAAHVSVVDAIPVDRGG
ncbi:MAG: oxalurate catabolism protein HpxZ [Bosea sp.]|nr:oxalurate catabolism protein HpxZ [Bosea sp. (in: a-proteobacteria)]